MNDFSSLIQPDLVLLRPALTTSTQVIEALGGLLVEGGFAHPSLVAAALEREATYPTGLLLDAGGINAAIPHADREHVVSAAVAVAVLRDPVSFRQMDDPDTEIPVRLVFLLALPDAESQLQTLRALGGALQDAALITKLMQCSTPVSVIESFDEGRLSA